MGYNKISDKTADQSGVAESGKYTRERSRKETIEEITKRINELKFEFKDPVNDLEKGAKHIITQLLREFPELYREGDAQ